MNSNAANNTVKPVYDNQFIDVDMEVTTIWSVRAMLKLMRGFGPPDHDIQVVFIHK
jgi:hypothetical protein